MNAYDTIFVDIQSQFKAAEEAELQPVRYIHNRLVGELEDAYPDLISGEMALVAALETVYDQTGCRFVIIFDEWDYPIRELDETNPDRIAYTEMLCGLFKNNAAKSYIRLAYLTPESLRAYSGEILLVGIEYDKKTKEHSCIIEHFC